MANPTVVILAAGEGTRMRSSTPKVLHELCGLPLVAWSILAARSAGAGRIVVVDGPRRALDGHLPEGVEIAVQAEPNGTGDALKAAVAHLDADAPVVVINGDVPLITSAAIAELVRAHEAGGGAATMITMQLDDPTGYGRVVRDADGNVVRVVETKHPGDATAAELELDEVNTGIFCFDCAPLLVALEHLRADNAQGEHYLPDVLPALTGAGHTIGAQLVDDHSLTLGVNDRADLALVREHAQRRIHAAHMRAGVTIVDPGSTLIDATVTIGRDTRIEPGTSIRGASTVGEAATLGPHTTVIDCAIGDGAKVLHSYLVSARVDDRASVGPFAYLRPDAHLHEDAKVGTFVEVKNSKIGAGAKVPHLSYIGDADIGEGANIGAGTITANYDGRSKHRTTIGANVRISVDTRFVAPVTVGDGAYTAAGSVITDDVPPGALGVARERQRNIEGYADRSPEKSQIAVTESGAVR